LNVTEVLYDSLSFVDELSLLEKNDSSGVFRDGGESYERILLHVSRCVCVCVCVCVENCSSSMTILCCFDCIGGGMYCVVVIVVAALVAVERRRRS
jgi:hypothetical protein